MKINASKLLLSLILLLTISAKAQPHRRVQKIGDAISLLGLPFNKMADYLAEKGYSYISKNGSVYSYEREVPYGLFKYEVGFTNYKVEFSIWSENIYYGRDIIDEIEYNGLLQQKTTKLVDFNGLKTSVTSFKSIKRNLGAIVTSKPEINEITVSIYRFNPKLPIKVDNKSIDKQLEENRKKQNELAVSKKAVVDNYNKFLKDLSSGSLVIDENKNLDSYVSNSHLLDGNTGMSIVKEGFKSTYNEEGLKRFIVTKFKNETIYFVVTKDGKLDRMENWDGTKIFSVANYPELNNCVTTKGRFILSLNDKIYETAYRYAALSIKSETCTKLSYFYFTAQKKEIQHVKDSTSVLDGLNSPKTSKVCPARHNFRFDKELLEKSVFKYVGATDMKSFREITKIKSKAGNNFLMAGLAITTGSTAFLGGISDAENLFRYVESQNREIVYLTDFYDVGDLKTGGYNLLNTSFTLEKFSKKEQKFVPIK